MNRLSPKEIYRMAHRFMIATEDAPRKAIVDSLGFHPVNHAWFARYIGHGHANDWQVYLDLTKNLCSSAAWAGQGPS